MKTLYFCAYHADNLRASETEAIKSWSSVMRRGMKAYCECRIDAAEIYLESALDIALIRSECSKNCIFDSMHLLKPIEFLTELYLTNEAFTQASKILNKVSRNVPEESELYSSAVDAFLITQFKRLEQCECAHLHHSGTNRSYLNLKKNSVVH